MSADPSAPIADDSAVEARLSRELSEAEAALQRVIAEHTELKRLLGQPADVPKAATRVTAKRPQGGYRGPDVRVTMEAAIAEINSAVASIDIDNAMLRSRAETKGAARDSARLGRTIGWVLLLVVGVSTALALWQSPREWGPIMLLIVTVGTGVYALMGWAILFSSLGRYGVSRRALADEPQPIAGARAGRSVVIRGTVVGRNTAFDAWYPSGEHAIWQDVRVIDTRGFSRRRREQVAHRHREAATFQIADAAGDRLRVELAGAEVVPEYRTCSAKALSRPGRQELDAISGILGDRDELDIEIEMVRVGATVVVQGRISDDAEPVLRGTSKSPLRLVALNAEGGDGATQSFREGLRIGVLYTAFTIVASFAVVELLTGHH